MATLVGMFKAAMAKAVEEKREIKLALSLDGIQYKLASNKSVIWVTLDDKGADWRDKYLGAIELTTGLLKPNHRATNVAMDKIIEHMTLPTVSIKNHGRKTGWCCMCGRMLVAKNSVRYAIGPICASKWGIDLDSMAEEEDKKIEQSLWDEL